MKLLQTFAGLPGICRNRLGKSGVAAALIMILAPGAAAQETQDQALARLDAILATLRDVRDTTRTMSTLESALEGSVSRFTCARLWGLGFLLGDAGAEGKFSASVDVAFRVITPFGTFQTYFADNGAPLHLGLTGSLGSSVSADVNAGLQNWNCWTNELWFDSPDLYDTADYELPYAYNADGTPADPYDSQPDPGFVLAVAIINGLVDVIKEMGLDPSDAEVVSRMLSGGGTMAIEALGELAASGTPPERAARSAAQLVSMLGEFVPGHAIVDGIESMLSMDWVESLDPCAAKLILDLEAVCTVAMNFGDKVIEGVELVTQISEWSPYPEWLVPGYEEYIQNYLSGPMELVLTKLDAFASGLQDALHGLPDLVSDAGRLAMILDNNRELVTLAEDAATRATRALEDVNSAWDEFMARMNETYEATVVEQFDVLSKTYRLELAVSYRPVGLTPDVSFDVVDVTDQPGSGGGGVE